MTDAVMDRDTLEEAAHGPAAERKGLANNVSSFLMAQVWHRACLFVAALLLARAFGSGALGRLLLSISFVWMFWVVIDAGLCELFIRDVAAAREKLGSYLTSLIRLKGVLAAAGLGLMWLTVSLYGPMREHIPLVMLLGAGLVCESYGTFFRVLFRIQERMHIEAALWTVDGMLRLLVVVLVTQAVRVSDPLLWIAAGWLLSSLFGCFLALGAARTWWPRGVSHGEAGTWSRMIRRGMPFAIVYVLSFINLRGMIFLIGVWRGEAEAGYFGAAERILEVLLMLPIAVAHAVLPLSARLAQSAISELRRVTVRTLTMLLGCAMAVSASLALWGRPLVRWIYGAGFEPSSTLMSLLGCAMLPLFLKPAIEKILCGLHWQEAVWKWYAVVTLSTLVLAVWLVPSRGLPGAALCLLLSEAASVGGLAAMFWYVAGRASAIHA